MYQELVSRVSVVVPIYDEEALLLELHSRLGTVLSTLGEDWEVIFVDDGSRDGSPSLLDGFARADPRFKVVHLSRNFGHQQALTAGLHRARGDGVVLMDGDLQDPPEVIAPLVRTWKEGNDVVLAVRRSRPERGARRLGFDTFYRVMRFLSDLDLGVQSGVFCLLDRNLVEHLNALPEHNRYIPGLRGWLGFRQGVVLYDREERRGGKAKQSFPRLVRYGLDAIFSFSYKPLRLASFTGALIWLLAGLYALLLLTARLLEFNVVRGFTTTTVAVLGLGGLQLLCLGILGEYLARIYDEVKRRPLFIEREFVDRETRPEKSHGSG